MEKDYADRYTENLLRVMQQVSLDAQQGTAVGLGIAVFGDALLAGAKHLAGAMRDCWFKRSVPTISPFPQPPSEEPE